MSLTDQRTGKTAAETLKEISERERLQMEMISEQENAELIMLRAINKQLMLKLSENDEWLKEAKKDIVAELQSVRDNSERLLMELEARTTAQIAENGETANKSIAVFYRQLLQTCDITDQKLDGMISANEEFLKAIDMRSVPIAERISKTLDNAVAPIIAKFEKTVAEYGKETKRVKRLVRWLGVSAATALLALAGMAYLLILAH